jgi:dinuclear metal center YbgI/SA1388 family protein
MHVSIDLICKALAEIAPLGLAEPWDNVGLLVGDRSRSIGKVMTCLTVTPEVVNEAINRHTGLIVTHHPIPFRPLARITCDSITGQSLWRLIGAQIAVYSAHTAFDSAAEGINQTWAEFLGLTSIRPIIPPTSENDLGSGRFGELPTATKAGEIIRGCGKWVAAGSSPRAVGPIDRMVSRVGFACGSGGSFISDAHRRGCELLITGEASFHSCLEAETLGLALGLLGHFQSERFAMERLAERLQEKFPGLSIWPSHDEVDPIVVL